MFGLPIDLYDLRESVRALLSAHTRSWMGAAFVAAAMISIQYQEVVAPHVSRLSDAWSSTTLDLGRKLSGLTL